MATTPAVLLPAWMAYQAGNAADAIWLSRQAVETDPHNADAWCLLGMAQRAAGQHAEAEASQRRALVLRPDFVDAWNNLGNVLLLQEKLDEAVAAFEQVLRLQPNSPMAHNNLGAALRLQNHWAEAAEHCRQALRLKPDYPEAHNNLGEALRGLGRTDEAAASFRDAVRLRPYYPEAHTNLGSVLVGLNKLDEGMAHHREALRLRPGYAEAHLNLGTALAAQRRFTDAEASYREALRLKPTWPEAYYNLGLALAMQGRSPEAEACYREALHLFPEYADALQNLAHLLALQGRHAEAEACFRAVLRLRPGDAAMNISLGGILAEQGRLAEAEACYREALHFQPECNATWCHLALILSDQGKGAEAVAVHNRLVELEPDSPGPRLNRAFALLNQGWWEQAWADYEWRWRCSGAKLPYKEPWWDGSPLAGRTVLLHADGALGDTILFARYAPLVKQRGGTVFLACFKALLRLLASLRGVDRLLEDGAPMPAFDCVVPLQNLPGIFCSTPDTVPADVPYLFADPALVEHWRRELPAGRAFRVGIAWQGAPRTGIFRNRSFALAQFAPLAAVPGVQLISLQKGFGSEQVREVPFPVLDLGPGLDEAAGPFMDTAAVMKNLDLVIAPDTSLLHLAGALGVPAWGVLPFAPYWYWMRDREDSPWYPSVRLFRQRTWGDWEDVFERMAAALRNLACSGKGGWALRRNGG
jgi:tetratricopeptide (TPR) repeat protein